MADIERMKEATNELCSFITNMNEELEENFGYLLDSHEFDEFKEDVIEELEKLENAEAQDDAELEEEFDNWLDALYPYVTVGTYHFNASEVLKNCHSVAYKNSFNDWIVQKENDIREELLLDDLENAANDYLKFLNDQVAQVEELLRVVKNA